MVIDLTKVEDLDTIKEIVMTTPLGFALLKDTLYRRVQQLPDHRQGRPNTRYTLQDAVLGAFGIFFTQSPSFLEYQRRLQHTKGHNNAHTLFGSVSKVEMAIFTPPVQRHSG